MRRYPLVVPLQPLEIEPVLVPMPPKVTAWLQAAQVRIDAFFADQAHVSGRGFIPSDYQQVWRTLEGFARTETHRLRFCEWGSGFGVVVGFAVLLGMEAHGIEIDRVRTYGGHTLILRRGRPVAAVIPYHEYERFIMNSNDRNQQEGAGTRMTPAEIMAEVDRVREAIAADWAKNGRPPEASLPAAELIRQIREERTQQVLDAARGRSRAAEGE